MAVLTHNIAHQSWASITSVYEHRSEPLRLWHLTLAVHEEHDADLRHVLWRIYELQQ